MKSFPITILISCLLALSACDKGGDDLNALPGPNGLLPDGTPPRAAAPRAPDAGTFTGLETRRNPRPPQSGLNADPANPNGAPGTFTR